MKALLMTVLMMVMATGVSYADENKDGSSNNESVRIVEIR